MSNNKKSGNSSMDKLMGKYLTDLKRIFRYDVEGFYSKGHSYVRDRLDEIYSFTIRIRDRFVCFTCGRGYPEIIPSCGHLITRSYYQTRWDGDNGHCQCNGCNYLHEERPDIYIRKWVKTHGGYEAYDALVTKAHATEKMTMGDKVGLFYYWRIKLKNELTILGYLKEDKWLK